MMALILTPSACKMNTHTHGHAHIRAPVKILPNKCIWFGLFEWICELQTAKKTTDDYNEPIGVATKNKTANASK